MINPGDDWWQQWFCDNGVAADEQALRRPGVRLDNQANEGHAAMAGQGFALLTPFLWQGDVAAGRLAIPFPEPNFGPRLGLLAVFPPERRMVPKVKRFREWLLAVMEEAQEQAGRRDCRGLESVQTGTQYPLGSTLPDQPLALPDLAMHGAL